MPKKAGKQKKDASQRTLFSFHSFRQAQGTSQSSPCKATHPAGQHASAATSSHNVGSTQMVPQPSVRQPFAERPKQAQQVLPPAVPIQGPQDCRDVAHAELRKQMIRLNQEQKGMHFEARYM